MAIKWSKTAVAQLLDAIRFIEENDFYAYAEELEREILLRIRNLPEQPAIHPLDKYRVNNMAPIMHLKWINTGYLTEVSKTKYGLSE